MVGIVFKYFLFFFTDILELFLVLGLCLNFSLPDVETTKKLFKSQYVEFYDMNNQLIDKIGDEVILIDIELIPTTLIHALVAAEDKNFFKHQGLDYKSLIKNIYINLRHRKVIGGGSTLSQQLSKNILQNQSIFSFQDRSVLRKTKEIILTYKLEKQYSKNQILYFYLNRTYYGKNCYGIETAAQFYFKKSASALNLYESVLLAGLLQSPSKYSSNIQAWKDRARVVLRRMQFLGFITQEEERNFETFQITEPQGSESNIKFFTNFVMQQLPEECQNRDIKIITTFDPKLYEVVNSSLIETQNTLGKEWDANEAAFVIIEKNGAIRTLIGGLNYAKSNFNIASHARRPSGSVAKYYTYLTAIEMGLDPKSLVDDSPYSFGSWHPSNYLHNTIGKVQVDVAFAQSINSVSLRLIEMVKPEKVIKMIKRLQINDPVQPNLALALGGLNTSLLNLTKSFLPIINRGYMPRIYCMEEIRDAKTEEVLYKNENQYKKTIDQRTAYYMWQMMKRTVSEYGTGRKLNTRKGVFGGKSGTSNEYKDLYFILANTNYCMGCWFGREDFQPMHNEKKDNLCISALNKILSKLVVKEEDLTFELGISDINIKSLIELII